MAETEMLSRKPAPGSMIALENGCICPRDENQDGRGVAHLHPQHGDRMGGEARHYCIAQDCPVHGFRE